MMTSGRPCAAKERPVPYHEQTLLSTYMIQTQRINPREPHALARTPIHICIYMCIHTYIYKAVRRAVLRVGRYKILFCCWAFVY